MKSSIKRNAERVKEEIFPVLRMSEDQDFVVAFTSPNQGVVVWAAPGAPWSVLYASDAWDLAYGSFWKPFNGSITLEN